ncbi:MAG: hypothetical protein ABI444_10720 [Candidatus Kapaibacterium sp.]
MRDLEIVSVTRDSSLGLRVRIVDGHVTVESVQSEAFISGSPITVKALDATVDILYTLPHGQEYNGSDLEFEMDLHVPISLAVRTNMHWSASLFQSSVLIQPVSSRASIASPLYAAASFLKYAPEFSSLLLCENASLFLCTLVGTHVSFRAAPMSIEDYTELDPAVQRTVLELPHSGRLLLSGEDVRKRHRKRLSKVLSSEVGIVSEELLESMCTFEDSTSSAYAGRANLLALAIGTALHLASGEHSLLAIR